MAGKSLKSDLVKAFGIVFVCLILDSDTAKNVDKQLKVGHELVS